MYVAYQARIGGGVDFDNIPKVIAANLIKAPL